jgi:hypothetical protein
VYGWRWAVIGPVHATTTPVVHNYMMMEDPHIEIAVPQQRLDLHHAALVPPILLDERRYRLGTVVTMHQAATHMH